MNNLVLKSSVVFIMLVIVNNIHSQNMGELVGSNKRSNNQNYKNPMLSLNNFLISINKGKWLMDKKNTKIGHGTGPYFRCNIYRGQAVSGTQAFWSSDYFGIGLEYFMFLEYSLKKDVFLNIIANFNVGFHQYYEATIVNSSGGTATISQEFWGLRLANQQLISIAVKKYL